jgi:excisionase family DNA binding protein
MATTALPFPATESTIAEIASELVQRITAQVTASLSRSTARVPGVEPRLLTAEQAGEYIGRTEKAVRHLIYQRDIPTVRNGRCVRIDRKDLDRWIENNKG